MIKKVTYVREDGEIKAQVTDRVAGERGRERERERERENRIISIHPQTNKLHASQHKLIVDSIELLSKNTTYILAVNKQ